MILLGETEDDKRVDYPIDYIMHRKDVWDLIGRASGSVGR